LVTDEPLAAHSLAVSLAFIITPAPAGREQLADVSSPAHGTPARPEGGTMDTRELAKQFVAVCATGDFEKAGRDFWADDVVSLEPTPGEMAVLKGRKAVAGKGAWWTANHDLHSCTVEGPYVHGDRFIVRFKLEVTPKGQSRLTMDETGLFTVKNGKIAEESFFFGG
jgi:SnoaL-like protein